MNTFLQDKTVLVIGGSRDLGEAVVRRAAAHGARTVIGARDTGRAEAVARTLTDSSAIHVDITDESSIADAAARLGSVDHIVITTSQHHNVPVRELQHDGIVGSLAAKVTGPLLVAKHFAPLMPPDGSLLLFSGVAAWRPAAPYTVMGVANGAVSFLVTHLAHELAPIRVNAISPGITDSGVWDDLGTDGKTAFLAQVAEAALVNRVATRDDVADAAAWLLGAGTVTGETIHLDGGARHR